MDTVIVNFTSREKRYAVIGSHRVETIVIDRPENRSLVGNIYYGTVTKVLPGMNAVFIDIGEEKNAYLHRDALASFQSAKKDQNITSFVHQGEKLLVQVAKDATGTKGPRVTGIVELQGNHLIYLPKGHYVAVSKKIEDEIQKEKLRSLGHSLKCDEEGLIFRTSSAAAGREEMIAELSSLRLHYEELVTKAGALKKPGIILQKDSFTETIVQTINRMKLRQVIVDDMSLKQRLQVLLHNQDVKIDYYQGKENIFSVHHIEHEIDKALKRVVWLDNGAYLVFDETEALTIIDVNTGKFSGKSDYQDTVFKTNQLAAREIVRQLRLRDIGGIVLIDFIDMKRDQDRHSIAVLMEKELAKDEKSTKMIGFTPLGILQLTRKKTKVAISEALQVRCPVCQGTGRILSPETVAFRLERELLENRHSDYEAVLVETTKDVKQAFIGADGAYLEAFEDSLHMKVYFTISSSLEHYYVLKQFGGIHEIAQKAEELY